MIVDVPGIPLVRRTGEILYALVDPDDFVELNLHRWHTHSDHARTYVVRSVVGLGGKRHNIYMHREIMGLGRPGQDERVVDHVNGNPLDNRRANLRIVTRAENMQNQRSRRRTTSRFRGVCWDRKTQRWHAQANVERRNYSLGYFDTEEEAAAAAEAFRAEHMPFAMPDEARVA